jgi:CRP-like cAMP-binding protein
MYFIESGKLSVSIQKFTQNEVIDTLESGDCFGEMAFISGEHRSASVIALTDVVLLVVSKDAFINLLSEDIKLASRVEDLIKRRNKNLATKEYIIDYKVIQDNKKFHLGIKGDPSLTYKNQLKIGYNCKYLK